MATEYEWKFCATPGAQAAVDAAFDAPSTQFQMETTYYDTPSGALSARHFTLRKRMENGVPVCTLKAPAGTARGEWECECACIEEALPLLLAQGCPKILLALVSEGIIPVCGARFTRLAKTLVLPACTVELALDAGELFGGGRHMPLCEIEVELKSGTQAACDAFAGELAARFSLVTESKSKFKRALALYKGEI